MIYFDVGSQDSPLEIKTSLEMGSNTAEIQTEYLPQTRRQRTQEWMNLLIMIGGGECFETEVQITAFHYVHVQYIHTVSPNLPSPLQSLFLPHNETL